MTALPAATEFTGSTVTEGQFKTAISSLRDFLNGILGSAGDLTTAQTAMGVLGGRVVAKAANYTVVAGDRGLIFNCTGTFTLSLTAAATLATGFSFLVNNIGTGLITIDPNSTELINAASTITVSPGEMTLVNGNGTAFTAASNFNVGGLTVDAAPDVQADYLIVWDSSLAQWKKVLIQNASAVATVLASGTLSGTSLALTGISGLYRDLQLSLNLASLNTAAAALAFRLNADTGANYGYAGSLAVGAVGSAVGNDAATGVQLGLSAGYVAADTFNVLVNVFDYASAVKRKMLDFRLGGAFGVTSGSGIWRSSAAVNAMSITPVGSWDGGTYELLGLK